MARGLRPVAEGETAPKPMSVAEAADRGDAREFLVAMRNRLARAVDDPNAPAQALAALTKRLNEVVKDIEAIDAREEQEAARGGETSDGVFDSTAI